MRRQEHPCDTRHTVDRFLLNASFKNKVGIQNVEEGKTQTSCVWHSEVFLFTFFPRSLDDQILTTNRQLNSDSALSRH